MGRVNLSHRVFERAVAAKYRVSNTGFQDVDQRRRREKVRRVYAGLPPTRVVHFGELANLTIEACVSPCDDPVDEAVSLGSTNICVAIGAEGTRPNPAAVGVGRVRLRSIFDLADKEVPVFRSDRSLNRSESTQLFLSGGLGFRFGLGLGLGLGRVAGGAAQGMGSILGRGWSLAIRVYARDDRGWGRTLGADW